MARYVIFGRLVGPLPFPPFCFKFLGLIEIVIEIVCRLSLSGDDTHHN